MPHLETHPPLLCPPLPAQAPTPKLPVPVILPAEAPPPEPFPRAWLPGSRPHTPASAASGWGTCPRPPTHRGAFGASVALCSFGASGRNVIVLERQHGVAGTATRGRSPWTPCCEPAHRTLDPGPPAALGATTALRVRALEAEAGPGCHSMRWALHSRPLQGPRLLHRLP